MMKSAIETILTMATFTLQLRCGDDSSFFGQHLFGTRITKGRSSGHFGLDGIIGKDWLVKSSITTSSEAADTLLDSSQGDGSILARLVLLVGQVHSYQMASPQFKTQLCILECSLCVTNIGQPHFGCHTPLFAKDTLTSKETATLVRRHHLPFVSSIRGLARDSRNRLAPLDGGLVPQLPYHDWEINKYTTL